MSIIDTAETAVAPYLTWIKVGAAILAVVGLLAAGAYGGYRFELGKYETLVANDAKAKTAAVQEKANSDAAQAKVSLASAVADQKAQDALQIHTTTVTKEITRYVTAQEDRVVCVPVGLARIMRSAADGSDPASLGLAPGQSDDDCSDVTASEVAGWFTAYAGAAQQNAQQLNDLEAWVRANHEAQVSAAKVAP